MKKKLLWICGCTLTVAVVIFTVLFMKNEQSPELSFVDNEMKNTLINATVQCKIIESTEDFRMEYLDEIERLNIGYTGYYTTLEDIQHCINIHTLYIGIPNASVGNYYKNWSAKPKQESRERIVQIEKELADILQSCDQLRALYIYNDEGTCELSNLDFLEQGKNLTAMWLDGQKDIDYSPIFGCTELAILTLYKSDISDLEGISALKELEELDLRYTNISEAGDIVKLSNLKVLEVYGTPLAENEEELALIYEALPNVKIDLEK